MISDPDRLVIITFDSELPVEGDMLVGDVLRVRAAFANARGEIIGPADVVWGIGAGNFSNTDLTMPGVASDNTEFRPSRTGTAVLVATYVGQDYDPTSRMAVTGIVTVLSNAAPAQMTLLAGNGQDVAVGSSAAPLEVELTDAFGEPVLGAAVDFEVSTGLATLAQPSVFTDAAGRAKAIVTAGNVAGVGSVHVSATARENVQLHVVFILNTLAAAPSIMGFFNQPSAAATVGRPFGIQPVVSVTDAYGNAYQGSEHVHLSVGLGSGALAGTLSAPVVGGVARFSDIAYDTVEVGILLRATLLSLSVDSASFAVGAPSPGACQREDEAFRSANGGCLDIATGIAWSSLYETKAWTSLVWDSFVSGADEPDLHDAGATNDYEAGVGCEGACDSSLTAICHMSNEADFHDWRLPTHAELRAAFSHSEAGTPPYLADAGPGTGLAEASLWSSTTSADGSQARILTSSGGSALFSPMTARNAYCVREDRSPPLRLRAVSVPAVMVVDEAPRSALIVQVEDTNGRAVNAQGLEVTLVGATPGALGGDLSAVTDSGGRAVFPSWTLDAVDSHVVQLSSTDGLNGEFTVNVTLFPHACAMEDNIFQTAEGGCQHVASSLVWSQVGLQAVSWPDAIWDVYGPSTNFPSDVADGGRTNDYDNDPGSYPDDSSINHCHELGEGGYDDWRVPTLAELLMLTVPGAGAGEYFSYEPPSVWTSSTYSNSDNVAFVVDLANGAIRKVDKGAWMHNYLCVRNPLAIPASELRITHAPRAMGVATLPGEALTVQVVNTADEPLHVQGLPVLISVSQGLIGGASTAQTDRTGVAVFQSFTFDTIGDLTLTVSGAPLNPDSVAMPVGSAPHSCRINDTLFATTGGGCRQQGAMLVWSLPAPMFLTWYAAVWDFVSVPTNSAPEASDGVRTNDYDGTPSTFLDNSTANYCHDLVEGGRDDWRMPTRQELLDAYSAGASSHFGAATDVEYFSGTSTVGMQSNVVMVNLDRGSVADRAKANVGDVICVRR